jgi:hypothetical protein
MQGIACGLVLGLACACVQPLGAATIFDNSQNDLLTRFNPGTVEVGDQVILAGTERYLTEFRLEYWGTNALDPLNLAFDGNVQARVRFYLNDGTPFNGYDTPGTMFYDSQWFSLNVPGLGPPARSTILFQAGIDFVDGGLLLPVAGEPGDEFTWSIQFRGMSVNDSIGIDLYSPPVIGSDYPDYWQNTGAAWLLQTNAVPMDFAALMTANQVPEPSSTALWIGGGVILLTLTNRMRRSR